MDVMLIPFPFSISVCMKLATGVNQLIKYLLHVTLASYLSHTTENIIDSHHINPFNRLCHSLS